MSGAVGSVLRTLGHAATPSTPSLSVTDAGDGTGATATVSGSDGVTTNTVYTTAWGAAAWTSGGARSGDGTVSLSLGNGRYFAYCVSAYGTAAAVSVPVLFAVTDGTPTCLVEDALCQILSDHAGVSALVGFDVYAQQSPAGQKYPYLVYRRISADHARHLGAASGVETVRFQVDCYADGYLAVRDLAEQVRLALDGYGPATVTCYAGTVTVHTIRLEGDSDDFEPPMQGAAWGGHRRSLDFMVTATETVPTFGD